MPQHLNEKIELFNRAALERELTVATNIYHQIHAITQDIVDNYRPTNEAVALQKNLLLIAKEAMQGMLGADSKETFLMHQKRLDQLIASLKNHLDLQGDLNNLLDKYRFFNKLHQFLQQVNLDNRTKLTEALPAWFKKHALFKDWNEELDLLVNQSDKTKFESHRNAWIKALLEKESYQNLANFASMALVEQNTRLLADSRLSYLKEANSHKKLLKDVAWMGGGVLLIAAAAVLGLAFPPLVIPGLVLGAAVLGYGAVDFSKESAELYSEFKTKELGAREFANIHDKANGNKKPHPGEAKWIKGAGYAASFAGLGLAMAALALIIPGIGIPLAAVIAVTVASLAIAGVTAGILGFKTYHEQKSLQTEQAKVDRQITEDAIVFKKIDEMEVRHHLSSMAKVMKIEMEESKQSLAMKPSIKPLVPEEEDEESEGETESKEKKEKVVEIKEELQDEEQEEGSGIKESL
ncbi:MULTISPECIES: hypothetical protein [unclassified Legionella]|uniref:hypothetical protein n=1 Tax=unclassified Legionella TaxID=2622702 RepID=UPI0010545B1A|nr:MULTISPECIES: hypothetical protein [unclassified Legionella]MDI9819375.1 hypothetical protein [Legionella sp. PL877]